MNDSTDELAAPPAVALLRGIREDRFDGLHELLSCPHYHVAGDLTLMLTFGTLAAEHPDHEWAEQDIVDRFFQTSVVMRDYELYGGDFAELGEDCCPKLLLELAPADLPAEELNLLLLAGEPAKARPEWFVVWRDEDRFILLFASTEKAQAELRRWREAGR